MVSSCTILNPEVVKFSRLYVGLFSPKLKSCNWYSTDIICISNSPNTVIIMCTSSFNTKKIFIMPTDCRNGFYVIPRMNRDYSLNRVVYVLDMQCFYCKVYTEFLTIIGLNVRLQTMHTAAIFWVTGVLYSHHTILQVLSGEFPCQILHFTLAFFFQWQSYWFIDHTLNTDFRSILIFFDDLPCWTSLHNIISHESESQSKSSALCDPKSVLVSSHIVDSWPYH